MTCPVEGLEKINLVDAFIQYGNHAVAGRQLPSREVVMADQQKFLFGCTPTWSVEVMNPKAVLNDAEVQPPSVAEYVATFTQRAVDYVLEQFPDSMAADIQA